MKFDIINGNFDVEFSTLETLAGLKKRLIVPLDKIVSVKVADNSAFPWTSLRMYGTGLGFYSAGNYRVEGERTFVNAHRDNDLLVIETENYIYPKIILDHKDMNQEITTRLLEITNG